MVDNSQEIMAQALALESAPSLSPLALRLVEMASDDQASVDQLASIIEQDPGLAAKLLRLANSAAFRPSDQEVTSISRALVILGLREVRIMALGLSLRHTIPLEKDDPEYYFFWRSSLHRAVISRRLALALDLPQADEAFVAALLQELGLTILVEAVDPDLLQGFPGMNNPLEALLEWERENLGMDHRQLGRRVMEHWELPGMLAGGQDYIQGDEPGDAPPFVRITDLARRTVEAMFLPQADLAGLYPLAQSWLGLDREQFNTIITDSMSYVGQAAEAMDIELNHEADLLEIMETANLALSRLSTQMAPAMRDLAMNTCGPEEMEQSRRLQEQTVVNTLQAVAHEIRNPLMSVGGFARRLAKQLEAAGEVRHYAEVIVAEAGRLNQVLAEMNELAAPYRPTLAPVDVARLVREALEQDQGQDMPPLEMHLPGGGAKVSGDAGGLARALRLMMAYGAHLRKLGQAEEPLHVHLANGGRPVLSIFGRGAVPGSAGGPLEDKCFGPELGLAQARRILEAHGGRLEVKRSPQGAGFVLSAYLTG